MHPCIKISNESADRDRCCKVSDEMYTTLLARCYNRETLNSFARHYETGEPLPEDLYQKLVAARTFRSAPAPISRFCIHTSILHSPACRLQESYTIGSLAASVWNCQLPSSGGFGGIHYSYLGSGIMTATLVMSFPSQ